MSSRAFITILNTLLVFAWARFRPAPMFSWRLHVNGPCYAPNTGYGSPCNTCTVPPGIWVMNEPFMLLHLVHLALFPATSLPLAGFIITLKHLLVVMVVITSARFWNDCIASEQKQRSFSKMGVSAVFTIGFIMFLVFLTCIFLSSVILFSAIFFFFSHPLGSTEQAMEIPTSSVYIHEFW